MHNQGSCMQGSVSVVLDTDMIGTGLDSFFLFMNFFYASSVSDWANVEYFCYFGSCCGIFCFYYYFWPLVSFNCTHRGPRLYIWLTMRNLSVYTEINEKWTLIILHLYSVINVYYVDFWFFLDKYVVIWLLISVTCIVSLFIFYKINLDWSLNRCSVTIYSPVS